MNTSDRNAIIIAPKFFHYDVLIENELKTHFNKVHRLFDRPFKSSFLQILSRFAPGIIARFLESHYRKEIAKIEDKIDYILIINGQTLPPTILEEARKRNPDCTIVLYMWDSFQNRSNSLNHLKYTTRSYTFDSVDAQQHGLVHLPLFSTALENAKPDTEYDLCFIGTLHTDRHIVLNKLVENTHPKPKAFIYLYVKRRWIFLLLRLLRPSLRKVDPRCVHFKTLNQEETQEKISKSKAIIDIEHPNQRGLTIRTIECICRNKKIVTTNKYISQYDFFEPQMIRPIDRENPNIEPDFFNEQDTEYDQSKLEKLVLKNWMSTLVSN